MEMTTKGRSYVTARGWEDLSEILYLYEDEALRRQMKPWWDSICGTIRS